MVAGLPEKNKKSPSVRIGRGINTPINHPFDIRTYARSFTGATRRKLIGVNLSPARLGSDIRVAYSALGLTPSPIRYSFFGTLLSSSALLGFLYYTKYIIIFIFNNVKSFLCSKCTYFCFSFRKIIVTQMHMRK